MTTYLADTQVETTLRAELDEVQPIISAAILVATAFRMRNKDGLMTSLRGLSREVRRFEDLRAPADAAEEAA